MTYKSLVALAAVALAAVFSTAAHANLVSNGTFQTFSNASNGACSSTPQVVNNGTDTSSNLGSWVVGPGSVAHTSYTFDLSTSNYTSFTPLQADNGNCNAIGLQTTITASPDGGNFIAADPSYEGNSVYTLAQTVTGLIVGQTYKVDFSMGAGQQQGFVGNQTDTWTVGLGNSAGTGTSATTPTLTLLDRCNPTPPFTGGCGGGFSGWVSEELSFIAAGTSQVLWFLAQSTAATGQPPFVLLDGVTMNQSVLVPEPPAFAALAVALLGLFAARRFARRKG